jgi:hypothetical protein
MREMAIKTDHHLQMVQLNINATGLSRNINYMPKQSRGEINFLKTNKTI